MVNTEPAKWLPEAARMPGLHAGFWMRVGAYMLDGIILSVPALILYFLLILPVGLGPTGVPERAWPIVVFYLALIPGQWLYFALFESSRFQATPGKMVLGIVVTDIRGERIGFGRASGRYFAKIISGMIFYIGFMMAGWTARKQGLHDLIAETCVVRKLPFKDWQISPPGESGPPHATAGMPVWAIVLVAVASVFGLIFVGATLAAIAIPLYLGYAQQVQTREAISFAGQTRDKLNAYHSATGHWPPSAGIANYNRYVRSHAPLGRYTSRVKVTGCAGAKCEIEAVMRDNGIDSRISGKTLVLWTTDGGQIWHCGPGGDDPLPANSLPVQCRSLQWE